MIATASATAATDLASSGLADNPALHAAIVAPLVLIGLTMYLVRRRRNGTHNLDGGDGQHGSGAGGDGSTDWKGRA